MLKVPPPCLVNALEKICHFFVSLENSKDVVLLDCVCRVPFRKVFVLIKMINYGLVYYLLAQKSIILITSFFGLFVSAF